MHFIFRLLIALAIVLVGTLMPALLLQYLGHEIRTDWNDQAVETSCTVINHYTTESQCSYSCNCVTINKVRSCQTCYYTCYKSYATIEYIANERTVVSNTFVATDSSNGDALAEAIEEYPLGYSAMCWYQPDDVTDWRWELHDTTGYIVGFWLFIGIGIILTGLYTWYEIYRWRHRQDPQ